MILLELRIEVNCVPVAIRCTAHCIVHTDHAKRRPNVILFRINIGKYVDKSKRSAAVLDVVKGVRGDKKVENHCLIMILLGCRQFSFRECCRSIQLLSLKSFFRHGSTLVI